MDKISKNFHRNEETQPYMQFAGKATSYGVVCSPFLQAVPGVPKNLCVMAVAAFGIVYFTNYAWERFSSPKNS